MPLIPGITDTEDNINSTFVFMLNVGLKSVALLPYNTSAAAKYEWLGLNYGIQGETQDREYLSLLANMACQMGLNTVIG